MCCTKGCGESGLTTALMEVKELEIMRKTCGEEYEDKYRMFSRHRRMAWSSVMKMKRDYGR